MPHSEPAFEALRRRVERLEAAESARQLLARYCRACDRQDIDALVELFVPDCRLETAAGAHTGLEEVAGFFRQAWAADPAPKSHFTTNVRTLDAGPGSISIDAYFLYIATDDGSSVLGWGEYRDEVDVTGPSPRFQKKAISMTASTGVRHMGDLPAGWERGS